MCFKRIGNTKTATYRSNYPFCSGREQQRMWGTSQGDRTLTGAEAALVRKSVGHLRDMITAGLDLDEPHRSEVDVFDRLQPTQQLSVLHEVAHGLLDPQTSIMELTAVREGTVHTIYREIFSLVEIEIDLSQHREIDFDFQESPDGREPAFNTTTKLAHQIRATIVSAWHELTQPITEWNPIGLIPEERHPHSVPEIDSTNLELWSSTIEFLANQVLWDRDFEMEPFFADLDPAKVADIKLYMGIQENYFSSPAPDANSADYQRLDRELVALTRNLKV